MMMVQTVSHIAITDVAYIRSMCAAVQKTVVVLLLEYYSWEKKSLLL